MDLRITVKEPIHRGDNLNKKLLFLIPKTIDEVDIQTASVFLNYIRADGIPDVVCLERMEKDYNQDYFQYSLPLTCRLTKCPGEVCTWIQIYSGTPSNPTIAKSSECLLYVEDSKNMDDYICDHQLTAIYQLKKKIESTSGSEDNTWSDMTDTDENKDGAEWEPM